MALAPSTLSSDASGWASTSSVRRASSLRDRLRDRCVSAHGAYSVAVINRGFASKQAYSSRA